MQWGRRGMCMPKRQTERIVWMRRVPERRLCVPRSRRHTRGP